MRKSEENNKFRKRKMQKAAWFKIGTSGKHICPPGECDLAKNVAAASIREWIMKSSSTRNIGK